MSSLFPPGAARPRPRCVCPNRCCQWLLLAAAALAVGIAEPVPAQTSSPLLTFEAALDAALARSETLKAQDSATRAARAKAVAAGRLPDPVLRLSVDNLPVEGPIRYSLTDDFMTMRSVSVAQSFVDADKRGARSARYEREADASLSMRSLQQTRLLIQTARSWLDRHFQERTIGLLERQRMQADQIREAMASAYRAGRSSQADVLAAHAAVARIDDQLHEARAALDNARDRLQRWIGESALNPMGDPPAFDHTLMAERPLNIVIDQHPDIALIEARERLALADAQIARQDRHADWSWSLMYSKRGSQFGDMVSLGVSVPLQWDRPRKQDRELAARLDQVEQARSERVEARRERLFEAQRLLTSWRGNLARLAAYDQTLIPLASERVQATEVAFQAGDASLVAALEARRQVTDTLLERLRIEQQTAVWWAELEFLIPNLPEPSTTELNPLTPSSLGVNP